MKSSRSGFAGALTLALAFIIAVFLSVPASAANNADPFSRVQRLIDAWNKGDMATVNKGVTPSMSIIDEFPPYSWTGTDALKNYMRDYTAALKSNGVTEPVFTLSQRPTIDELHDTNAYIVVHGVNSYKQNGNAIVETGVLTVVLQKMDQDWRITSCAWTKD